MPATLEKYVQEAGRAGRDDKPSEAILYPGKGCRHASSDSLKYQGKVSVCRRRLLYHNFVMYSDVCVSGCACCDICKIHCTCSMCTK